MWKKSKHKQIHSTIEKNVDKIKGLEDHQDSDDDKEKDKSLFKNLPFLPIEIMWKKSKHKQIHSTIEKNVDKIKGLEDHQDSDDDKEKDKSLFKNLPFLPIEVVGRILLILIDTGAEFFF
ncbi:hypothetical protein FQA39_LY12416 [Lamprigera yunnana]|nr:hypothetical protein FQA39_LY12416 [Lamprigera yunnana]